MNDIFDLAIIGAGPAGLMAAKTAAELGLKVVLIEKNRDFKQLRRACSAQFIMDDGYENELLKVEEGKLVFVKNNFSVNYTGDFVEVKNKYYKSPKGHRIHFALPGEKAFALKFDKRKLLDDLCKECEEVGVDIRMGTIACCGADKGDKVVVKVFKDKKHYEIEAKKLIIAEGVNARLTGIFGFNKGRMHFATAFSVKYFMEGITGIEPNSWNLFYGRVYHSNAPVIIGPSLHGDNIMEVTISGHKDMRSDVIFEKVINDSPLKENFKNAKLIDKQGCPVKAFASLKTPYKDNVIVIGDSAAFVEVETQGALMCGYKAANAVKDELEGRNGFEEYCEWWKDSFEFNNDDYLLVSQGYALVPTYTDDELDYLFGLVEGQILEGTYSQYKTPKLIWASILAYKEKIKNERPEIYAKIEKMNEMTLTDTFKK